MFWETLLLGFQNPVLVSSLWTFPDSPQALVMNSLHPLQCHNTLRIQTSYWVYVPMLTWFVDVSVLPVSSCPKMLTQTLAVAVAQQMCIELHWVNECGSFLGRVWVFLMVPTPRSKEVEYSGSRHSWYPHLSLNPSMLIRWACYFIGPRRYSQGQTRGFNFLGSCEFSSHSFLKPGPGLREKVRNIKGPSSFGKKEENVKIG